MSRARRADPPVAGDDARLPSGLLEEMVIDLRRPGNVSLQTYLAIERGRFTKAGARGHLVLDEHPCRAAVEAWRAWRGGRS